MSISRTDPFMTRLLGTDGLALAQQIIEELLVEFPGPMRVGIGKGGTLGTLAQPQVLEFAFTALESVGDLAHRPRLSQLTEKHRDKLLPTGEALGPMLGLEVVHVSGEIRALKK